MLWSLERSTRYINNFQLACSLLYCKSSQWSSSQALTKTPAGFVGRAKVPWDRKILYKFIVDGKWALKNDQPIEVDLGTGFVNHVYISPPKPVEALLPSRGGKIADAGEREATKGVC